MEVSMYRGFTDLGMDELSFIHQVNSLEELFMPPLSPAYSNPFQQGTNNQTLNFKSSLVNDHNTLLERPTKQLKTSNWNNNNNSSCKLDDHLLNSQDSYSNILSFANSNCLNQSGIVTPKKEVVVSPPMTFTSCDNSRVSHQSSNGKQSYILETPQVASNCGRFSQSKDHIIAERKRREKLSQRFIALSAIVPGLKKMDKASVLADAIKYIKQMQERVKTLEEQSKKAKVESVVCLKRSQVIVDDGIYIDNRLSKPQNMVTSGKTSDQYPEIEARFSNKDVLVRIQCEKKNGMLEKIITEIEKLHLVVVNTSSLAFGSLLLDVTIIGQMDAGFGMTPEDLVRHLHATLKPFI